MTSTSRRIQKCDVNIEFDHLLVNIAIMMKRHVDCKIYLSIHLRRRPSSAFLTAAKLVGQFREHQLFTSEDIFGCNWRPCWLQLFLAIWWSGPKRCSQHGLKLQPKMASEVKSWSRIPMWSHWVHRCDPKDIGVCNLSPSVCDPKGIAKCVNPVWSQRHWRMQ